MAKLLCAVALGAGTPFIATAQAIPTSYTPYTAGPAPSQVIGATGGPAPSQVIGATGGTWAPPAAVGATGGTWAPPAAVPAEIPGIGSAAQLEADSQKTANLIGGLTESFFGGTEAHLSPKEVECISHGAGKFAGGMLDTAGRTAQTMKAFAAQAKYAQSMQAGTLPPQQPGYGGMQPAYPGAVQQPAYPSAMPYAGAPQYGAGPVQYGTGVSSGMPMAPGAGRVDPLVAGLEITARCSRLMDLEQKLVEDCLQQDAKAAFRQASKNMMNMSYIGGHLIANGIDIMKELALAAESYEKGDYRKFGDQFGMAARKTLLSKEEANGGVHIVVPSEKDIESCTKHLVDSMFGGGMTIEIWDDAITTMAPPPAMYFRPQQQRLPNGTIITVPTQHPPPAQVPWVLAPATDVTVDVHTCVQGNKELFKTAWDPVFTAMSKMAAAEQEKGALAAVESGGESGAKEMGQLAMSMLDMQIALRRCGFTTEQESMLYDAYEAGQNIHAKIHVPHEDSGEDAIKKNMQAAIKDWQARDYDAFGDRVGTALREVAVTAFPEKYYVDSTGRLRRQIVDLEQAARAEDPFRSKEGKTLAYGAVGACVLVAAAMLAVRGRHVAQKVLALRSAADSEDVARETEFFVRADAAEAGLTDLHA